MKKFEIIMSRVYSEEYMIASFPATMSHENINLVITPSDCFYECFSIEDLHGVIKTHSPNSFGT